jgi:hypothetical protein
MSDRRFLDICAALCLWLLVVVVLLAVFCQ